jgi:hypothetical protein
VAEAENGAGKAPDGVTLGLLIALRQDVEKWRNTLDSLIGAHSPPQPQGAQEGAGKRPPPTFGNRPSTGG